MKYRMVAAIVVGALLAATVAGQRASQGAAAADRTITIKTEPNAVVWIDEIRRGVTDANGVLSGLRVSSRAHSLRVRATGFRESSQPLPATTRGTVTIHLLPTTDQAELAFQQAETARETARDEAARQGSAELYQKALKLRPAFPAAHVGLARVLLDLNDTNGALAEIEAARRSRPAYAEASAVEGRIYRVKTMPPVPYG